MTGFNDVVLLSMVAVSTAAILALCGWILSIRRKAGERERVGRELQKKNQEQQALLDTVQRLASSLDVTEVLQQITAHSREILDAYGCAIYLVEPDGQTLRPAISADAHYTQEVAATPLDIDASFTGQAVRAGRGLIFNNAWEDPSGLWVPGTPEMKDERVIVAPLMWEGKAFGAMCLNRADRPFTADDLALLETFATYASIAIQNARLFEAIQQANAALAAERGLLARRVTEATAELRSANAELARALRLKDEFLSSMSHELRTPLHAILGMAQVLESEVYGPLNEGQRKAVRTVDENGRRLLGLINNILDLAKIGAGQMELEMGPVSVQDVCQASLMAVEEEARRKDICISPPDQAGPGILWADEGRLVQMLVSLLENAVKFTPRGGQIGLQVAGDAAEGMIHFSVWDTGIGIPEDKVEQLFEPFVQLEGGLSRPYEGTGLGLALVHRLAEMHGGQVRVESQAGEGSTFTVSLPWRDSIRP